MTVIRLHYWVPNINNRKQLETHVEKIKNKIEDLQPCVHFRTVVPPIFCLCTRNVCNNFFILVHVHVILTSVLLHLKFVSYPYSINGYRG